jgi:hypothetical protein
MEGFLHQWTGPAQQRVIRRGQAYIVLDGRLK